MSFEDKTVRRLALRVFHNRFRIAGVVALVAASLLVFYLLSNARTKTPVIIKPNVSVSVLEAERKFPPVTFYKGNLPTIMVSIASYRDGRCPMTVQEVFKKAKHPERLVVGIVQQNKEGDKDCAPQEFFGPNGLGIREDQIRILRVSYRDAQGPCWARQLATVKLYQGEDYFFQIDSHLLFNQDWDETLMTDIQGLPPKSTISHYPHAYEDGVGPSADHDKTVPFLCSGNYRTDPEFMVPGGSAGYISTGKFPIEVIFMAAGLMLLPKAALLEVPYDPYLPFLFVGEELTYSVRMAAKGYRFFSPSKNIAFHFYGRKDSPHFWDPTDRHPQYDELNRKSRQRIEYILGIYSRLQVENATWTLRDSRKYGIDYDNMDDMYNLDRYYRRWKIDFKKREAGDFCQSGPPKWED